MTTSEPRMLPDDLDLDNALLEVTRLLLPGKLHQLHPPSPGPTATVVSFADYVSSRPGKSNEE